MNNPSRFAALVAACVVPLACAQWTDDPAANTPVVVAPSAQDVSKLAVAPDGSTWHGWFDFQPGGIEVRVQRLAPDGTQTFAPGGLVVSSHPQNTSTVDWDLRADADGNCVLAFTDIRDGGDNDVYAYLISPSGAFLWGPDGVAISDNAEFEADPRVFQLSGGDYVVLWPRFDVNPGIVMQRLAPAGTKAFAGDGILISVNGTEEPAFVEAEPTSDNGFNAVWVRDIASFFSFRHLHGQGFDANGAPQWGAAPVYTISNATSVPIAHKPRIITDADDGAWIAWHDTRDGDFDCYIQHINQFGQVSFAQNGVPVSTEPARQQLDPAIAIAPGGDLMVFFRNMDGAQNQQSLNVQRIAKADGSRALGSAGVPLLPFNGQYKGPPRAAAFPGGVAGVCDLQPTLGNNDGTLQLLLVDDTGASLHGSPIGIATTPSGKGRLAVQAAPGGALVASWTDDRNGNADVYAQRVNADGSLGGPADCPADFTSDDILDFFDVQAFLQAFSSSDPSADFTDDGLFDFFDVQAFLQAFSTGCP